MIMSRIFSSAEPGPQLTWTAMTLEITKVTALLEFHATLDEALSELLSKPMNGAEGLLKWEERLSIDTEGKVWDRSGLLGQLRKICIFLASSEELRDDRDKFEIYFRQLNDELLGDGCYLVINRWENFLDTMSETRLQDEYNRAVKDCDVFVSLFCTKALVDIDSLPPEDFESLRAFKAKLKELGHYPTSYNNIEDLKRQFRDQL